MKSNTKFIPVAISLAAAGLLAAPMANAATSPAKITSFATGQTKTLQARPKGWMDPAFGDAGWTHHSAWGKFSATKGQHVTITLNSGNAKVHPAITVWHRGAADTAPNKYVIDHFYQQNANQFKFGAKDETTNADIGNIVMKNVHYCYDRDGNKAYAGLHGMTDGTAGRLVASFVAPYTGAYMFVIGGLNPGSGVDSTKTVDISTQLAIH
jgi:hypothetical protein